MEEDQEVRQEGHEVISDGQEAQLGDQEVRQEEDGEEAQEEVGLPLIHHIGDQALRPHQGPHAVLLLRYWDIGGHGRLAMAEVQGDGDRPLLHLDLNLCCPLRKEKREKRKRVVYWKGCAMRRPKSCLPVISGRSWRARSV